MKKKVCYLVFIMLMSLYVGSISVSADTQTGSCGANAMWTYDSTTHVLTISGTGDMDDYALDPDMTTVSTAPYRSLEFTKVIIQKGITSIGDYAFAKMMGISSISIPSSVTEIGKYAFGNVGSLNKVTIPTSVKTIENGAFYDCGLTKLTLNKGLKTIGSYAFGRNLLEKVSIPSSVERIEDYAFESCKLTSITIPSSVTYIGKYVFFNNNALKTVSIKGRKTKINKMAFAENEEKPTNVNLIIYGYKDSTAEKYAIKYKMGFRTFGVKVPSRISIQSLSKNKTRAKTVIRLKKASGAWKYEIQISRTKSYQEVEDVAQIFTTKTKVTLKGLSKKYTNRKIYVRARVYKKVKGKIVVSNWSKVKSTKMKK